MIERKLFLLLLVLIGSMHWDLYSGKNKPHGKTPIKYQTRTVKYVPPADKKQEVRDAILGHRKKENISCRQFNAALALGVAMSVVLTCIRPYDPERPIEMFTTPCMGMLIGFFLGVCLWHGKPSRFNH